MPLSRRKMIIDQLKLNVDKVDTVDNVDIRDGEYM